MIFRELRLLLIVAPTLFECHATVKAFGLSLERADGMRFVTRAHSLRGWSAGTPFLAINRRTWGRDFQAIQLDDALTSLTLSHRLRIASERDLAPLRIKIAERTPSDVS